MCEHIKSNLRLKEQIISEENGKHSFQINSILRKLNTRDFKTFKGFIKKFDDVEYSKNKLINFQLFIIMDCDDCTIEEKKRFLNKDMFTGHWLK